MVDTTSGVIGTLLPDTVAFQDPVAQPTLAAVQIQYIASPGVTEVTTMIWMTTMTQAEVRSLAKDTIRADIIQKFGVTVPKSQIKMLNSPE